MINLFVTSNDECWENVPADMSRERCLRAGCDIKDNWIEKLNRDFETRKKGRK